VVHFVVQSMDCEALTAEERRKRRRRWPTYPRTPSARPAMGRMGSQLRFVRGSSGQSGPGQNFAGLAIFRYSTRCGTVYGHLPCR
jgi:hypothetical protein